MLQAIDIATYCSLAGDRIRLLVSHIFCCFSPCLHLKQILTFSLFPILENPILEKPVHQHPLKLRWLNPISGSYTLKVTPQRLL